MALTTEQKASKLYKQYQLSSDTKTEREFFEEVYKSNLIVSPNQMWTYGDHIPCGTDETGGVEAVTAIRNLNANSFKNTYGFYKTESEFINIVKKFEKVTLSPIDNGTDNAFILKDDSGNAIKNIIPFNFYEDLYNYKLYTSTDKEIFFGVGDWALDCYSGILTFYGEVPTGVDHSNPPKLSFYQYVGGLGFRQDTYGFEGTIIPIQDFRIDENNYCVYQDIYGTLASNIENAAEVIEDNFVSTYGWDGSDKNEGVALSLEPVIPLYYSASKDNVKGYDNAADTELGVILSHKSALPPETESAFAITFVSPKCTYDTINLVLKDNVLNAYNSDTVKIGSCNIESGVGNLYKIALKDDSFIVVEQKADIVEFSESFSITTYTKDVVGAVYALIVYWSSADKDYLPIRLKDSSSYDFGFPVVTVNGKIPPSAALRNLTLGSTSDSITPNYYGPRTATIVIAKEDYTEIESADYVIKDVNNYRLSDTFVKIKTDYPEGVIGTILFRPGTYTVDKSIDLTDLKAFKLMAEADSQVVFIGSGTTISFTGATTDFVTFENITFDNVYLTLNSNTSILSLKGVSWLDSLTTLTVTKGENLLSIHNVKANDTTINTFADSVNKNTIISNSTFKSLAIEGSDVQVTNTLVVNTFTPKGENFTLIGNTIGNLNVVYDDEEHIDNLQIRGCVITTISEEVPAYKKPTIGSFPIYSKESDQRIRYATFSNPFFYNETDGKIELLIDNAYFYLTENGELSCHIDDSQIKVDNTKFVRPVTALDEDGKAIKSTADTLQDALIELYGTKADLVSGKVPLQQLPDSVAYGGLLYVGSWTFETDPVAYPTFDDVKANLGLSLDKDVTELQPGWFVVIDASTTPNNPTATQKAPDDVNYTAGDWCIWNGSAWEKLDKAYQDAAYSYLPVNCPDNLEWSWKKGGHGALDLSEKTITQAFDDTNQELKKLQPQKPSSITNIELAFQKELETYSYIDLVQNGTLFEKGTTEKIAINPSGLVAEDFTATTPQATDYKSLFYVGTSADVTFTIDSTQVASLVAGDTALASNNCSISEPIDPYENEPLGKGYWTGIQATICPIEVLADGEHSYKISVSNTVPNYETLNGTSKELDFTVKTPYDLSSASIIASSDTSGLERLLANGACSGIPKLATGFENSIDINLYKFTNGSLRAKGNFFEIGTKTDDVFTPYDNNFATTSYSIQLFNEEYLAKIKLLYPEEVKNTYENYTYPMVVRVYNEKSDIADMPIDTISFIKDPTLESERVRSGASLYPDYTGDSNNCGAIFNSIELLTAENNYELLKRGRNIADESNTFVSEYSYPYGNYAYYGANTVSYESVSGLTVGDDVYRFATFASLENNDLLEANGFIVAFDVASDKLSQWTYDNLTGSTNGLILQAKIIGEDSETGWLDCNSPIRAFDTPQNNGDAAMYAGSSTATQKRVSFGKNTKTGKLVLRVGIAQGSNLSFTDVKIKEII